LTPGRRRPPGKLGVQEESALAEVIRDAIAALARASARPRPTGGLFASGDPSLSARAEEALAGFGER
jgi:hypothetical protein